MLKKGFLILLFTPALCVFADNIIDEIVWVVGDEAILKSDVEAARLSMEAENIPIEGNPRCIVPEQLAVQKLYLHQADLDSIYVTDADALTQADYRISRQVAMAGSEEKLEEYIGKSLRAYRAEIIPLIKNNIRMQRMQQKIVSGVKTTPAEVRNYAKTIPTDSLPLIPAQVEVQILAVTPAAPRAEVDRVEELLREFTARINSGETSFSTLATLYSQDGSARNGGELPYTARTGFVPEFSNVAFALTDPKKVSRIVRSEYGHHIIQLIDKKGDLIKVRHILIKPDVPDSVYSRTLVQLDSVATHIREGKVSFENAVYAYSDDKLTRSNRGIMVNIVREDDGSEVERKSRFELGELPVNIAMTVDTMEVGAMSKPIVYTDNSGKKICAIVKLKDRIPQHRANVEQDLQVLTDMLLAKKREEALNKWVDNKIKTTYVSINRDWRDCSFKHEGWIK